MLSLKRSSQALGASKSGLCPPTAIWGNLRAAAGGCPASSRMYGCLTRKSFDMLGILWGLAPLNE